MVELNREQQIKILKLARNSIYQYLTSRTLPQTDWDEFSDEIFKEKCGAFVTLHINNRLRGCIGYIKGMEEIPTTIVSLAKSSAFEDSRFPPLNDDEYKGIDIEISILSPIEKVKDISEIVIGRDGLIISQNYRSGLLLPQVATEQNWDVITFLENTCYKAGLPGDAWESDETKIEKFSAQVFGEKELNII
ncbi:MAG: AmmeMemoRadiSam system protein A [Spirochaetota bacterium]|nr:AmmeMemoRadiSam system protein A [Spirochaetota bacterium]